MCLYIRSLTIAEGVIAFIITGAQLKPYRDLSLAHPLSGLAFVKRKFIPIIIFEIY